MQKDGTQESVSIAVADQKDDYYKLWIDPYKNFEFFMLEHRSDLGLDVALGHSGLLVSHVDHSVPTTNHQTKKMILAETDNSGNMFGNGTDAFASTQDNNGFSTDIRVENIKVSSSAVTALVTGRNEDKASIGFNEAPQVLGYGWGQNLQAVPNGTIIMEIENTAAYADGVDIAMGGASGTTGSVTVGVAGTLDDATNGKFLATANKSANNGAWTRVLFSSPVDTSKYSTLYVSAKFSYSSALPDSGLKNGTFYKVSNGTATKDTKADYSMRLLVSKVSEQNTAPTIGTTSFSVAADKALSLDVGKLGAKDADGDRLTLTLTSMSTDLVVTGGNGRYVLTPDASLAGSTAYVRANLSDGKDTTSATLSIKITDAGDTDIDTDTGIDDDDIVLIDLDGDDNDSGTSGGGSTTPLILAGLLSLLRARRKL